MFFAQVPPTQAEVPAIIRYIDMNNQANGELGFLEGFFPLSQTGVTITPPGKSKPKTSVGAGSRVDKCTPEQRGCGDRSRLQRGSGRVQPQQ